MISGLVRQVARDVAAAAVSAFFLAAYLVFLVKVAGELMEAAR